MMDISNFGKFLDGMPTKKIKIKPKTTKVKDKQSKQQPK